ncbi:MAG TPA: SDR family oxidoreductase, partial [Candidatus Xenobia bacterium]
QGFQVVVNGPRDEIALSNVVGSLSALPFDLVQEHAVREAMEEIREHFGKVDVLVNNQFLWDDAALAKTTDLMWSEVHDTNLKSVFYCTKAFAPGMDENGFGKIINVTSFSGVTGAHMAYAAACAGVLSLTRSLALELAPKVRVNAIAYGTMDEAWIDAEGPDFRKSLEKRVPLRRLCRPEDVADLVAYLALSGDFLTGQVIVLDGGESTS